MLYPKSSGPKLEKQLFENPTSEYRGAPFWAWNCKLNKDVVLKEIDHFKTMGMGGFHIHCRVGFDNPYLGEEFFEYVKLCNEKAKKEKMLCWLYDEDRWPSGTAGGMVTKDKKYRARFMVFEPEDYVYPAQKDEYMSAAKAIRNKDRTELARYEVILDAKGNLSFYRRLTDDEPTGENVWKAYLEISGTTPWFNNQSYVNTLDKKAIDRFIELTHEKYAERFQKDFGGSIPAIFTDEPQTVHKDCLREPFERKPIILPFTDDFDDTFEKAYGISLLDHLPELIWELPDGKISPIRYCFHRHVCERFSEAFCDNIGNWCQEHNIMLTGHMMSEWTLFSQTLTMGEAMRPLKNFQLPGIDMLCDKRELSTAKQAQSVSHQYGRPGVMSELYGVTGWDFDFRGHKLAGDWQAALGVTTRVHHLTWMSMAGEGKRDYPASIGYQSPWYTEYPLIENHFARLNTALTRGKPHVKVGVIHPIESYWIYWGPQSQTADVRMELENNFTNIIDWLLYGLIDFDFISESLLAESDSDGEGTGFAMGCMQYEAVVVPGCHTLRSTTFEKLKKFADCGGKIIFAGDIPRYIDAKPSDEVRKLAANCTCVPFSQTAILSELEPYRDIDISVRNADKEDGTRVKHVETGVRTNNMIYQMRDDGDSRWLFACHVNRMRNESIAYTEELKITIKGEWKPICYDTMTGEIYPVAAEYHEGNTIVTHYCSFHGSLLLKLEPGKAIEGRKSCYNIIPDEDKNYLPQPASISLSEPNVLLLDLAQYRFDDEEDWQPEDELLRIDNKFRSRLGYPLRMEALAQPWVTESRPPVNTLHLRFTVHCDIEVKGARLAMEDIERNTVMVNGERIDTTPTGWFVDNDIKSVEIPVLHKGINEITVSIPFGEKTNVEWCYILGHFGVSVTGKNKRIMELPKEFFYGDWTRQGLPFYTGNLTYTVPFACEEGKLVIEAPHYKGAVIKVKLDSRDVGYTAFAPYRVNCGEIAAGEHLLEITVFGHRFNSFGSVHNANLTEDWQGPNAWRTTGIQWSYEYQLKPMGILTTPMYWIEAVKEDKE